MTALQGIAAGARELKALAQEAASVADFERHENTTILDVSLTASLPSVESLYVAHFDPVFSSVEALGKNSFEHFPGKGAPFVSWAWPEDALSGVRSHVDSDLKHHEISWAIETDAHLRAVTDAHLRSQRPDEGNSPLAGFPSSWWKNVGTRAPVAL
ncbi:MULTISPECIES: hypothetical protein [unclassified Rathayibacter]|uniref:hypothetical protein n=1 Tax=unclassified Rathayibacter TaxID=2609250 RepID=UPI00104DB346|nr:MULTISPECIES: hypothetical protein [unclassified Rathayibacter]MCJ1705640.1 hypothetical protein [Rathayibacter sp. VKM Ac-2926]